MSKKVKRILLFLLSLTITIILIAVLISNLSFLEILFHLKKRGTVPSLNISQMGNSVQKSSFITRTSRVPQSQPIQLGNTPIQIAYDKEEIENKFSQSQQIILKQAIDTAINFYSNFVWVKERIDLIGIKSNNCSTIEITEKKKKSIPPNIDVYLFVTFNIEISTSIAYSTPCVLSPIDKRPVMGMLGFNILHFKHENMTAFDFYELTQIIVHEIFHVIAFNPALYTFYNHVNQDSASTYYSIEHNWVSFPLVVEWAKKYFNCSRIEKVFLESQGGQGSVSSHWDRSILWNDIMTSTLLKEDILWSGINNALLEDTGWYNIDQSHQENTDWGKNKGCSFYFDLCSSNERFNEFCYEDEIGLQKPGLTYSGVGVCQKNDHIMNGHCALPLIKPETQCKNAANQKEFETTSQTFGWNSKSYYSTLIQYSYDSYPQTAFNQKVQCYQSQCIYQIDVPVQINVYLKDTLEPLVCNFQSQKITPRGYSGSLICPASFSDFCSKLNTCNEFCNFGGFCFNGQCICTPGTSGPNCECAYGFYWKQNTCIRCSIKNCFKCDGNNKCLQCNIEFALSKSGNCSQAKKLYL